MKNIYITFLLLFLTQVEAVNFTVSNINDSGAGSFRQAIIDANNSAGQDTVLFNITGAGPHTIQPLSNLPIITDALIIDGYSQSGSSINSQSLGTDANLQIVLDGILNTSSPSSGLEYQSNGGSVSGLSIVRFADTGILLSSGATLVSGNFIGVLPDGVTTRFNGTGIHIVSNLSQFNLIGGSVVANKNLISGNLFNGILIESDSNRILGNLIGTDRTGSIALSGSIGVNVVDADNNIIGGILPAERNLISGNSSGGILVDSGTSGIGCAGTQIINNMIGLDVLGQVSLGNGSIIRGNVDFHDARGAQMTGNLIGGSNWGIGLFDLTRDVVIENNTIGGSMSTANATGIQIFSGAGPNQIGNPITQIGNNISFNTANGIVVERTDTQRNRIMFNTIFSNGGLGIDLTEGSFGVTANDAGDSDFGGNTLLNFPVLSAALISNGQLDVVGSYAGLSNENFIFEVFANQQCSASGNGEGEMILGYITGTTDGSGSMPFSQNFTIPPAGFDFITLLATDSNGNTSEFSQCMQTNGAVASFNVNVMVTGLAVGNTVELQNNLTDNLIISSNGISQFMTAIIDGSNYSVSVLNQPLSPPQTCSLTNASGTISGADILTSVSCVTVPIISAPQTIPATSWKALMLLMLVMLISLSKNLKKNKVKNRRLL